MTKNPELFETKKEIAKTEATGNFLAIIEAVSKDPNLNPDVLHRLIDANERIMDRQSQIDFNEAMARLQPKLPQIEKKAKGHNSKYAKMEEIDTIVRPLYTAEGFSVSYDSRTNPDGSVTYIGLLSHRSGHTKTAEMILPPDKSGSKNDIQAVGSTSSYAGRYLLKMLLNIIEKGEDNDGNFDMVPIDEAQFIEITRLIDESNTDTIAFCKHLKVDSLMSITNKTYPKAIQDLKSKVEALKRKAKKE